MDIPTIHDVIYTLTALSIHYTTSYVRYVDATEEQLSYRLNQFIARVRAYHGR